MCMCGGVVMLCCGVVMLCCGVVVLWCCGVCVCVCVVCCCGISQILRELEAGVGGPVTNPQNLSKYRAERPPFFFFSSSSGSGSSSSSSARAAVLHTVRVDFGVDFWSHSWIF